MAEKRVFIEKTLPFVDGQVSTDGVQYSSVATVGTTATFEVFNTLLDPQVSVRNNRLYFTATQKFTGLNGSVAGSLTYYWQARSEAKVPSGGFITAKVGSWANIMGTYQKGVGTLVSVEDTLTGYLSRLSLPESPIRIRLVAQASVGANIKGEVKNPSLIRIVGSVIPGT
jgi:hypothetical protein